MKCPFLIIRKDVHDKDGKKVGEEIEIQNCIKSECMVFDGATKLCSLLSSNMKSGVLIDDVKAGVRDIKEEMYSRSEAMDKFLSTAIQNLQEALIGRFDILKKQNEVMVLGFDRLVEAITNKFENIRSAMGDLNTSVNGLGENVTGRFSEMSNSLGELGSMIGELKGIQNQYSLNFSGFSETLMGKLNEYHQLSERISGTIGTKLDTVRDSIEKSIATSNTSMESIGSVLEKMDANLTSFNDMVRSEIGGIKTESLSAYSNISVKFDELGKVFSDVISPGIESVTKFMSTEISGLKNDSLSALRDIAAKLDVLGNAFATNLRPGLDALGEGLKTEITAVKNDSMNALNSINARIEDLNRTLIDENRAGNAKLQEAIVEFGKIGDLIKADIGTLKDGLGLKLDELTKTIGASNVQNIQQLQALTTSITGSSDSMRQQLSTNIQEIGTMVTNLKTDQITALHNVEATVMQLAELYKQSSDSLGSMSEMMRNLNSNYIESLSKIAGLAEGMRKGVDQVGKGMHDSVRDLVGEMKKEIGALEKQYEKTFGDIASLASRFDELNKRIKEMTKEVESEFKVSFDRQTKVSEYTKTILEHMKGYFEKEDVRRKDEQTARRQREAVDHFDRAALYYYRGNYELALNEINKSLEITKTAEYYNLKGLLLTELGKFDDSKKIFKEALKLEPNLAEIHNNLGLLYLKMKKIDDAVIAFQEAVKKNVNYANAFVNLGKAFIDLEKFDEAIKAYEKALVIDPANREANEAVKLYKEGKIGA